MTDTTGDSLSAEDPVDAVLAEYLQAVEAGRPPDQKEFVARFPQFARELREFFAHQEQFERAGKPFRFDAAATQGAASQSGSSASPRSGLRRPSPSGGVAAAGTPPAAGQRVRYFGEYELLAEIARGGMGVVFKARQVRLNRVVALKMILAGQFATADDVKRFQVEAENAAQLDHPNIVPVYEVGRHNGQHYFTMKLVEGSSLSGRAGEYTAHPRAAVALLAKAARAVDYAHHRGILHRDIKPGNILIDAAGEPQVTDFGLARRLEDRADGPSLTLTGAIVGSPSYMSPEQARGEKGLSVASDVYALGAVLYELLTGKPPFSGTNTFSVLEQVRQSIPARPLSVNAAVGRDLEVVCLKCLDKDPQRRYPSARTLAEDLERWSRGEPITARPVGSAERLWRWCRRKPAWASLAGVSAAAVATVILSLTVSNVRIRRQQRETDSARQLAVTAVEGQQRANEDLRQALQRETRAHALRTVVLADREFTAGRVTWTDQLLDECPPAFRDWEWRFLKRQCHRDLLTVRWEATQGEVISSITSLAGSPDGRLLAVSAGPQGRGVKGVRLWDAATGQAVFTLNTSGYGAYQASFSRDGRLLAAACDDCLLRVWDVVSGREICALKRPGRHAVPLCVAFSPDGLRLAAVTWGDGMMMWDLNTRMELPSFKASNPRGEMYGVAYSPDGKTLLTSERNGALQLWDARTGEKVGALQDQGSPCYQPVISPDGTRAATPHRDGSVKVWDLLGRKETVAYRGHSGCVNRVAFSLDGTLVASASGTGSNERGEIKVWEAATGKERFGLVGHELAAVGVAFIHNGQRLATVSRDGVIQVWDAEFGQGPRVLSTGGVGGSPDTDGRRRLGFSNDGQSLIAVLGGQVRKWEITGWTPSSSLSRPDTGNDASLTLNPDGRFVAHVAGKKLLLHDLLAGTQATVAVLLDDSSSGLHRTSLTAPSAVSQDGRWVAAAFADGTFAVYDTGTKTRQFTGKGHTSINFSPDGRRVGVVTGTGKVTILDTATGRIRWSQIAHPNAALRAMAFSPNGRRLATAGSEGTVKVWDAATGEALLSLPGHRGWVDAVAFSANGERLASGSGGKEGSIKVWDAVAGEEILTIASFGRIPVQELAFSPNGDWLVARSAGRIYVWDASPMGPALLAKAASDVATTHPVTGASTRDATQPSALPR